MESTCKALFFPEKTYSGLSVDPFSWMPCGGFRIAAKLPIYFHGVRCWQFANFLDDGRDLPPRRKEFSGLEEGQANPNNTQISRALQINGVPGPASLSGHIM